MEGQLPKEVVQERYERLIALVNEVAYQENLKLIGTEVEVLIANDEGRKDQATHRVTGRARDNRLVHIALPAGVTKPRPGDLVTAIVTEAGPYHLIADVTHASECKVVPTHAGDAWDLAQAASCGVPTVGASSGVSLGIPTIRKS